MLLLNLTVDNFGVFRGTHSLDLSPVFKAGHPRHLTIFSGHNGAGKSTLFQAITLALYGSLAFSDPVTSRQYSSFISNRIHRLSHGIDETVTNSSVKLSFQYIQSGLPLTLQVERRWQRQGRNVQESLTILQDGHTPDVDPADYQVWLRDLVSPDLGSLCFFDAEKLDAFASPEQQNKMLRDTLERLLGLDLVQRLQADIEQYTLRKGGSVKIDHLYAKALEAKVQVEEIDKQLTPLRKELEELAADLLNCEAALAEQERRLTSEGGTYAARKNDLERELQTVRKELETTSNQIRDLVSELLPFALIPELCLKLSRRLTQEIEIRRQQSATALWREKLPDIESTLIQSEVWNELDIAVGSKKILVERLMQVLGEVKVSHLTPEETRIYHLDHLADPEYEHLQQWISQVIQAIPQQVQDLGKRLRMLRKELQRIETDIARVPDDAMLVPIHNEILRLRATQLAKQKRQKALNEQIGSLQYQREEKSRVAQKALAQYEEVQKIEKQLMLADRSKLVLRTYRDALTLQKLHTLEELLKQRFNRLCRKEHLLSQVSIDPRDFSVQLKSSNDATLELSNFSAGERQLYALALLWALRSISVRQLPFAIDTPLARLDEMHRSRFIHDYVPEISDQVLLFTTDAELDENLLAEAQPYTARIYRLKHDSHLGETTPVCEDPWDLQHLVSSDLAEEEVNVYGI